MYVWQMNDGRWHVSAYTSTKLSLDAHRYFESGYETRADAENALTAWKEAGNIIERRW